MLSSTERLTVIQEANTKTATAIFTTSPTHNSDSEEILERPTKRPRITQEMKVQDLATRNDASRQAVLQTNELLEGILSFLPPKQLFVDQRACKQWRNVVASSPELQKKMFLRVAEVPRQRWGLKVDDFTEDLNARFEVQRFDNGELSWPWRQVTPVYLSPHLNTNGGGDEGSLGTVDGECVAFQVPCGHPLGRRSSLLDTFFSNPPCLDFTIYLDFTFEPPIPGYGQLYAEPVKFKTGKPLKFGEALDKAMAIRTDAKLHKDGRDKSVKTKQFGNSTLIEVIDKLQRQYRCTAILCESSMFYLENVVIPNEQRWAEVDAAFAKKIQHLE